MPFNTIWEKDGIKWEFYGHVTAKEIEEANQIFFRDSRSKTSKYQLVHALGTESVEWKPVDLVDITFKDVAASQNGLQLKVAYISDNKKIKLKIEKYVEMSRHLNSDWEFQGFISEEEARSWLNS